LILTRQSKMTKRKSRRWRSGKQPRSRKRAKKTWLYLGWLDQQDPVHIGIQAYIGLKTRLPRTGGISSKDPTWHPDQNPRAGSRRNRRWEWRGWKIKLIILMEGTSGSVNVQIFNNNLKELQVLESKRNTIRKGLVHELPNAQDSVLYVF
jgi:hypothetical protein